jgi:hypothetical protein
MRTRGLDFLLNFANLLTIEELAKRLSRIRVPFPKVQVGGRKRVATLLEPVSSSEGGNVRLEFPFSAPRQGTFVTKTTTVWFLIT